MMIWIAYITSVLGSIFDIILFRVFRLLFRNGSFIKCKNPNLFESKNILLIDYCSNDFLERSICCSVGIELDNIMDFFPFALKPMIISDPL